MLKLTIATPDKRKVELECEASTTFAEVKQRVEAATSVPPDKQRLLCNGRERKDGKETLAAAGISAKTKMMLMLAPGYTMPEAPAAPAATVAEAPSGQAAEEEAQDPIELEGTIPGAPDQAEEVKPGSVLIRQGSNRYRIRVNKGLHKVTFGEIADYLAAQMLPPGIPPSELRLISKGKTASRDDVLDQSDSGKELTVMLLFREGFHLATEGARWMNEQAEELSKAEAKILSLAKRVEANFCDAETSLQLAEVAGFVETLLQSVDSVRVNATRLPAMEGLRERARKADERLQVLRKSVRF
ncbi:RUB3 [Symbiodinium pilosum]|uniref:RUB3 protein n=1 Tax=Symbiodinium pilosum TaxID=2952 RepID=A0A812WKU2_SYMPI|nr:RUB3 [Symbiodinium pilosum]